jgi:hypothetical protein
MKMYTIKKGTEGIALRTFLALSPIPFIITTMAADIAVALTRYWTGSLLRDTLSLLAKTIQGMRWLSNTTKWRCGNHALQRL